MPAKTLTMRHIKELFRLKYEAGLSHAQIAGALSISKGVGVTLLLLWEEYAAAHRGETIYRYTPFVERYHQYAGALKRSMRQLHRAGEKLFIDYAGPTLPYGNAGERAHRYAPYLVDFLELALHTGMRRGEILGLGWQRVDLKKLFDLQSADRQL